MRHNYIFENNILNQQDCCCKLVINKLKPTSIRVSNTYTGYLNDKQGLEKNINTFNVNKKSKETLTGFKGAKKILCTKLDLYKNTSSTKFNQDVSSGFEDLESNSYQHQNINQMSSSRISGISKSSGISGISNISQVSIESSVSYQIFEALNSQERFQKLRGSQCIYNVYQD